MFDTRFLFETCVRIHGTKCKTVTQYVFVGDCLRSISIASYPRQSFFVLFIIHYLYFTLY